MLSRPSLNTFCTRSTHVIDWERRGRAASRCTKLAILLGSAWMTKDPPHKWRYCTLAPPPGPTTVTYPCLAHTPVEILQSTQGELAHQCCILSAVRFYRIAHAAQVHHRGTLVQALARRKGRQ